MLAVEPSSLVSSRICGSSKSPARSFASEMLGNFIEGLAVFIKCLGIGFHETELNVEWWQKNIFWIE